MRRTHQLTDGALAALVLLAGCAGAGSDSSSDTVHPQMAPAGYTDTAQAGDAQAEYDGAARADVDIQAREVITTAEVTMTVPDPAEGAGDVVQLAESAGGRVDQRSVRSEDETRIEEMPPPGAWLRVRVPANGLEAFLEDLQDVGEVLEVAQSAEDVTQTVRELDARIEALQTSTDRLLEIMAEATDSADLIAAEEALSQRQAELESLQSQRTYLSDQVSMSTVTVHLRADYAPTIEPGGFTGGLQAGWHALITFVSGALAVAGMLVPWLPVIALPLALIYWVVRRRRRARAATPPAAATPHAATTAASTTPGQQPTGQPPHAPGQQPTTGQPPHAPGQPPQNPGSE